MKTRTNYRPRKKTQPPAKLPALDDGITIDSATALVESHFNLKGDAERSFKNKVRQRINYAIKHHKLILKDDQIRYGDFIEWAREKNWCGEKGKCSSGLAGISMAVDCVFHVIRPGIPRSSGHLFHADSATHSRVFGLAVGA